MEQEQEIELESRSTHFTGDNPIDLGATSSSTENPSEPKGIAESSFGPSVSDQPKAENVPIPGPSSESGQSDIFQRQSERMKTLTQNVRRQLRKVMAREEHEHPSEPQAERTVDHPSVGINIEQNEPPIEENRDNIRNLIERSRNQMRNCLTLTQNNFKLIITLLGILGLLATVIFFLVKAFAVSQHNVIPDIVPPPISPEYEKYRLPRSIKPKHYNLKILPILSDQDDKDTFRGEVQIHLEILDECQNITLHSHDLRIESIWLGNNETILGNIFSYEILTDEQFLVIFPNQTLNKIDKLLLRIQFNGSFNKNFRGLYRSSYNYDGKVKSAVMTQMEPTHAREVFPCFDEPGLQATFQITIGHKTNMTALSNMPGNLTSNIFLNADDDYVFTEFETTPIMSTYLVAFAVVDYKVVENSGIEIYSELSQNETNMLEVAHIGNQIFEVFNELLDYKYMHPKTTFVTSNDLAQWGMEHWGLITFHSAIVYPGNDSTIYQQEQQNELIAHEIAHQWFGNLITPEWWSHIWLTEGYSTYMSHVAIDKLHPQNDTLTEFYKRKQDILRRDAMQNTREVSEEVYAPDDIENNFNPLLYRKTASIIKMLDHVLTSENHISGLRSLLREKSFQTIIPDDLYKNLAVHSNTDFTFLQSFMKSWINQIGFPLVTVSRDPDNLVVVKQEKFYSINLTTNPDDPLWYIPLTYVIEGDNPDEKNGIIWMNQTRSIKLHNLQTRLKNNDWIIFNSDQIGFYRVNYEKTEWYKIIRYLGIENGFHNIAPINRALLIDDSLELAKAGYIDYTIPFDLLKYLVHENDYLPWTSTISSLEYVGRMLMKFKGYHEFKVFMQVLVRNIFKNISSIEPQLSRDIKLQSEIYEWACHVDLADCIRQSYSYMDSWIKSTEMSNFQTATNTIPINLRAAVYCTAVRHSADSVWYFLSDEFQHEKSVNEKKRILHGLSCTRSVHLLRDHVISTSRSRLIDNSTFYQILNDVSQNPVGFKTVMYLFRKSMEQLLRKTDKIENLIIESQIASKCNTAKDLAMIEDISASYRIRRDEIEPHIKVIEDNILWLKDNHRHILKWLTEKYAHFLSELNSPSI